ncbi:MAG: hypothetical protein NVS3B10_19220 [Polyangiales bacterium]
MVDAPRPSTRARAAPPGGGFIGEPNPLLVRELRQSLRLARLPWTITAAVALIGLGMLSIGSLESTKGRSAQLGVTLFQAFVSILVLYVALVGPATAAGSIALEREGKTLEPLMLTSLSAKDIARGKFLAAYATLVVQVVAIFPLAAIPLLFGGVTAVALLVGAVDVMAIAAVAVAFGLSVASRTQTLRGALAVSILLPAGAAPFGFGLVTVLGEVLARRRWPFLTGGPIWWSTAYTSVPFGLDYAVWLLAWPLIALVLPYWLFRAVTAANLAGPNDDHASGIKRWFVGASLLLSGAIFVTPFRVDVGSAPFASLLGQALVATLLSVMILILCGEPLAPSRLVRARWERNRAGALTRFLGPGLMRGAALHVLLAMVMLGAFYAGGLLASSPVGLREKIGVASAGLPRAGIGGAHAIVVAYTLMFDVFLLGLAALLRTRGGSGDKVAVARAWTIVAAIVATCVPWIVATISGTLVADERSAVLFAAPSPLFAIYAFNRELQAGVDPFRITASALGAAFVWGAIGLVLLGIAWERARKIVVQGDRVAKVTDRKLEAEDEEGVDDDEEEPPAALPPPPLPGASGPKPGDPEDPAP